jgi:hypothetical protein
MKPVRIRELPTELPSQQSAHGCLARTHHTHDEDNQVTSIFTSPSSHSHSAGVPRRQPGKLAVKKKSPGNEPGPFHVVRLCTELLSLTGCLDSEIDLLQRLVYVAQRS